MQCRSCVDVVILDRRVDRMPHAQAGEVIDHAHGSEMRSDCRKVPYIDWQQSDAIRQHLVDVLASSVDQVVDDENAIATGGELANQFGADEAGTASDENGVATHRATIARSAATTASATSDACAEVISGNIGSDSTSPATC